LNEIIEKQKEVLKEEKISALISLSPINVAYTLGFMVPSHPIIPRRHAVSIITAHSSDAVLVANMEKTTTKKYSRIKDVHEYVEFSQDPMDVLANLLKQMGLNKDRIGIEMDYIPAADFEKLKSHLPECSFVACDNLLSRLRMVKTKQEIKYLREVVQVAGEIHANVYKKVKAGDSEKLLSGEIAREFIVRGGDELTLLVVGSGDRSALPNARPTSKVLNKGEIIRVDIVGKLNNYYSDMARTIVVGDEISKEQKEIWKKIYETQKTTLSKVKAGAKTSDIYDVYKLMFNKFGFPVSDFVGHGIGLSVHEKPIIGRCRDEILKEGMVLCIEPFIFTKHYGYQLEDQVLVTKNGYELLSNCNDAKKLLTTS